ncbi:ATP-dependent helicase HrpB [Vibrio coralliilyticus]|uniref:ATP-dependent helicase HrpB n=1 Tax=Vibrio coralliilyticus TaxID=190893 RepID=A0A1V0I7W1_9VIBR|nr:MULTISPECIES: type III secretion system inner rod subunit SctI [Vibrio]AIU66835.1 ATP-dependent helicase HrpB [Vibrio coralliilyticus]ARC92213.1 EscI/YscI/HrpB family type III secretion system inner rod protein [Vibrio coralliilyticus]ERB65573.1 YscI/HrpB family type III secretion apparatus protein [Vibrio coralliilyticus OCN008]KFI10317.1 ATP-dependent helicase HrpB [Vibrio sp. B183]KJY70977.1 ATP-dependent helicase HrpB [Vibrio coralliilyticus]
MELSAIAKATYSALDKQAETVNPDKAMVDKFSQLMQQGTQETAKLNDIVGPMPNSNAPMGISPDQAIQSQTMVTRALVEVDLAAKTAGSLSQSINKLVTMQ